MTTDPTKRKQGATALARALRAGDTEPEYRLWGDLRARRLNGYKFVRQAPIGPYVADFLCREQNLVLELDGAQHSGSGHDVERDRWMNGKGYSVLRFWNNEVLQDRRAVLDTLLAVLEGRIVAPSPGLRFAPATLSPPGRGGRQARPPRLTIEQQLKREVRLAPLPSGERVASHSRPDPSGHR